MSSMNSPCNNLTVYEDEERQ